MAKDSGLPVRVPREVLTFGPGAHTFCPSDYPWLKLVRVTGQGGAASDGTPGEPGEVGSLEVAVERLPVSATVRVGAGGRGAPGAQPGDPGLIVIELFD